MRILHTSDWHVGRTIRGRSRAAEHAAVLDEIAAIARDRDVDLVLVGGDLFDSAAPTGESERLVYGALLELADHGRRTVLVIAGNHDSAARLDAVRPLLAGFGVTVRPVTAPPDEGGVVHVDAGGERAVVALVPFTSQRHVVGVEHLMGLRADQLGQTYADRMKTVIEVLARRFEGDTVNVVLAHMMAAGGEVGGGERGAHTVFDYWVPATVFPATAHYVALGHLHRAQSLPAATQVRYCGSPLQLDFGEVANEPCTLVVEARPGAPAKVEEVPLRSGQRLRTVRGTLAELRSLDAAPPGHLRVVVREAPRAGLADEVRDLFPDAVEVVLEAVAREHARSEAPPPSRLGGDPSATFAAYLAEVGVDDPRLGALFAELHEEVTGAT